MTTPPRQSRRQAVALLAGLALLPRVRAAEPQPLAGELELTALHSGESIRFHLREDDAPAEELKRRIAHVLRDRRNGAERVPDDALLLQLVTLAARAGVEARYVVISAYRSPESNAKMAAASSGVSSRSLHMEGRAIDVRLRGVETLRLATLARELKLGGVGYYAAEDFVHLDTGRVRTWDG